MLVSGFGEFLVYLRPLRRLVIQGQERRDPTRRSEELSICPLLAQDLFVVLSFSDRVAFFYVYFFILEGGERETLIWFSTYLCLHWLFLVCAMTGDEPATLAYTSMRLTTRVTHQGPRLRC